MKREIKFRGISQDKKFIYGDLVQDSENKRYAITPQIGKEHDYNQFEVLEITIGQYTGLKDKNGVEIYEGDIVKYKTYYYSKEKEVIEEVKWIDGGETDLFGEPEMYGFLVRWGECEIIGNIHENGK